MRALRIIGLAVATLLCFAGAAVAEPRVALVVGNSSYGGQLGDLGNPANDARLMAETLRGIGFDVIEAENADQQKMKRVIQEFGARLAQSGGGATGLFFYAGHGLQVAGTNYLIPIAARIEREADVDIEAVPVDLVMKQMAFAETAVNIVILDACRNNPLARGFRSVTRGLADPSTRPMGSFIAYSTAPGDVAEDGNGANSPYTTALAGAITKPGASINDVFQEVRGKVLAATDKKQVPWDASSLTAPFYFVPAAAQPAGSAVDPVELAFWDTVKDSKAMEDYAAYLAKYPNGNFVSLAQLRLKQLAPATTAAVPPEPRAAAAPAEPPSGADSETCNAAEGDAKARGEACQRLLSAGIADETERYNALMSLGTALFNQERYGDALKNYRAAADLDPQYFGAFQMIGRVALDQEKPTEALEALEKAVSLDPAQADSWFYRGAAKRRLGDYAAALADIERAATMNPEQPDYGEELGLLHLWKGDIAQAVADADHAARFEPDGWMIASMFAYYLDRRYDDALAMASRALGAAPDLVEWWVWKAMIQRAKGDRDGAFATLAEAQRKFDNPLVDFMAGDLDAGGLRRSGQVGDAQAQKQNRCVNEFYIGIQAALDGNKAEARAALRRVQGTKIYEYVEYMVAPAVLASLEPR